MFAESALASYYSPTFPWTFVDKGLVQAWVHESPSGRRSAVVIAAGPSYYRWVAACQGMNAGAGIAPSSGQAMRFAETSLRTCPEEA